MERYFMRLGPNPLTQLDIDELLGYVKEQHIDTLTPGRIGLFSCRDMYKDKRHIFDKIVSKFNFELGALDVSIIMVPKGKKVRMHIDERRIASVNFPLTQTISNTIFYDPVTFKAQCVTSYEDNQMYLLNINEQHSVANNDDMDRWSISLSSHNDTYMELLEMHKRGNLLI